MSTNTQAAPKKEMAKFDFDAYNSLTRFAPVGLKIVLAKGLLSDALYSLDKFNNPLAHDLQIVGNEIREFHIKYKAEAAKRQLAAGQPASESDQSVAERQGV